MVATKTESKHKGCAAASGEERGVAKMWRTMKSLTWLATALSVFFTVGIAQAQVPGDPLPAPDTGKQWSVTFDDEFNGTAVDTTKWNGQYGGGLQWCNSGQCPQNYSNVVEGGGIVQISPGSSTGPAANGLNTGGLTAATAKFSQRYGYWSVSAKNPPYGEYDGAALWLFPIGKSAFPNGCTEGNEEIDMAEGYNLNCPGPNCIPNIATDPSHMSFSFHDFCFNNQYSFLFPGNVDTSAGFHTYGLQWHNDGSAHGSFIPFFDGTQLANAIPTDPNSNLWDNGAYILLNEQGQSGPPLSIDWIHVYQQVAETGAPSISIASPTNEATVDGTITVTATVANAAGTYTKWYLPNAPVNGSCAVGQYDGAWNGCSLYGQLSFSYNTELLPKGPTRFDVQLYTSSGTYTGAHATLNLTVAQTPPPRISSTSPANGSTASGTITVARRESALRSVLENPGSRAARPDPSSIPS
jgi:beta-glucanase (GH16 family)